MCEAYREPRELKLSVCLEINVGLDGWKGRGSDRGALLLVCALESSGCRKLLCKALNS